MGVIAFEWEKLDWYVARSSGWVAFVLLACTLVWGVLGVTRLVERRGLPRWLMELHRHLALLTIVFTAIHLAALVWDDYMVIGWREILVPMAMDEYRPGAVTWGVIALYLLVAIQITSWLRNRLPRRLWRGVHMLSYPAMWMVTMHGLQAGTDAGVPVVRWGTIVVVGLVSFLTFIRLFTVGPRRRRSDDAVDTLVRDVDTPPDADRDDTGSDAQLGAPAGGLRTR